MKQHRFPGRLIVVEGPDGSGTTTISKKLAEHLGAYWTYEPTDDRIGQKVDEMISGEDYSPEAVALAFAADRMAHLEEEIIPRLKEGETVICDRYYHSSLVYQPAMGVNLDRVMELNRNALTPDKTFILDVSAEEGMSRVEDRGEDDNIFENLDFQERVVARYKKLMEHLDEDMAYIDASQSVKEVFSEVKIEL
jgi:dTMP kinase